MNTNAHCTHQLLENGVHAFTFHRATRQAIDEWIVLYRAVLQTQTPDKPLLILVDNTQTDALPLIYAMEQSRKLIKESVNYARQLSIVAVLLKSNALSNLMMSMVQNLPLSKTRLHFWKAHERENAIAWLSVSSNQ